MHRPCLLYGTRPDRDNPASFDMPGVDPRMAPITAKPARVANHLLPTAGLASTGPTPGTRRLGAVDGGHRYAIPAHGPHGVLEENPHMPILQVQLHADNMDDLVQACMQQATPP